MSHWAENCATTWSYFSLSSLVSARPGVARPWWQIYGRENRLKCFSAVDIAVARCLSACDLLGLWGSKRKVNIHFKQPSRDGRRKTMMSMVIITIIASSGPPQTPVLTGGIKHMAGNNWPLDDAVAVGFRFIKLRLFFFYCGMLKKSRRVL